MLNVFLDIETTTGDTSVVPAADVFKVPANLKDPDKIAAKQAELRDEVIQKAALYWQIGRVCCVCAKFEDESKVRTFIHDSEFFLLEKFAECLIPRKIHKRVPEPIRIITFNGYEFDVPFLRWRMAHLGVFPTCPVVFSDDSRYNKHHIDLYRVLTGDGRRLLPWTGGNGLDAYCKRARIKVKDKSGITGKDVPGLFEKGKFKPIVEHCKADVLRLEALFHHYKNYIKTEEVRM